MTHPRKHPLRAGLDRLYDLGAAIAAICLVGLLGVIVAQMVARWSGITFPGATQYAGYLMAASSFLAFAQALNHGAHIRVSLALKALGRHAYWLELWSFAIGSAAACYLALFAYRLVYWSLVLDDISEGLDATPLWIVQIPVAVGAALLALAFIDNLVSLVMRGHHNISGELTATSHGQ